MCLSVPQCRQQDGAKVTHELLLAQSGMGRFLGSGGRGGNRGERWRKIVGFWLLSGIFYVLFLLIVVVNGHVFPGACSTKIVGRYTESHILQAGLKTTLVLSVANV